MAREGKTFVFHLGESQCLVANQHLSKRRTFSFAVIPTNLGWHIRKELYDEHN